MSIQCKLSGEGVNLTWPFTMEEISLGMNFELREIFSVPIGVRRWNFEPLAMSFTLVTDKILGGNECPIKTGIADEDALLRLCENLNKAAIPSLKPEQGGPLGEPLNFSIEDWYSADGYMTNVNCTFKGPWSDSGKPNVVEVSIQFQPVMRRKIDGKGTYSYRRIFRDEFKGFKDIRDNG